MLLNLTDCLFLTLTLTQRKHTESCRELKFLSSLNLPVDLKLQHFEWRHKADLFLCTILVMKNYLQIRKQVHFVSNTTVSIGIRFSSGPVHHPFVKN